MSPDFQADSVQSRHILVIGGAGYIGSVLVRKLLANGYRVRVLDKLLYKNSSSIADILESPGFSFIQGDFCENNIIRSELNQTTDVVLLAALVGDPVCKKYPQLARRINKEGTINLFENLNGCNINRFIFMSTCSNYGLRDGDDFAVEEAELNPQSLYAETKVNVEKHILEKTANVDFCTTILRCATAYGISPRMRFDLTISEFTRELVLGRELLVYDENTWRPYCHVDDISEAIIKVLENPVEKVSGEVFNVGDNNENYTKKMIVEIALSILKNGKIRYKKDGFDPRNYRVSFKKIASILGFKNHHRVNESINGLVHALESGCYDDYETRKQFYSNFIINP